MPGLSQRNQPSRCDPTLLKAIARGRAWFEELANGRARSLTAGNRWKPCCEIQNYNSEPTLTPPPGKNGLPFPIGICPRARGTKNSTAVDTWFGFGFPAFGAVLAI